MTTLLPSAVATNLAEFNAEVDRFSRTIPGRLTWQAQRSLALEAFRRLALRTPVDTGFARNNWQITIGQPSTEEPGPRPATGQRDTPRAYDSAIAALSSAHPFAPIWIVNNTAYIEELENGSSKQAPAGMLAVTVAELRGWIAPEAAQ